MVVVVNVVVVVEVVKWWSSGVVAVVEVPVGDVSQTGQTANRHGQEVLGCRRKASRVSLERGVKTRGEEKEEEEYE